MEILAWDRRHNGMSKRILIVEDHELNMKLFKDVVQAHG